MRIGIVSYWFNRGQGVVARQLRSALDDLGHQTFILARPTRRTNIRPDHIERRDVWDQPDVTDASAYLIPWPEYEAWAEANSLDQVLFDQNYQFEEIERLRRSGLRTLGRFVWEHFSDDHVGPARAAFDQIYSMTACERDRYAEMGVESPRVHWGCHPDLIPGPARNASGDEAGSQVRLLFPGGFMSKRKPLAEVIEAFRAAEGPELRLVVKAQVERQLTQVKRLARGGRIGRRDRRIEILTDELPTAGYMRLLGSADAIIAPSRWEGLGLHLYEATALGVPVVTNDNPPMNEIVIDGHNGILVAGIADGKARSGITAYRPDSGELTAAIERLRDPDLRAELSAGARERRRQLSWERTVTDIGALVGAGTGEAG